jgi:hypothetical protein
MVLPVQQVLSFIVLLGKRLLFSGVLGIENGHKIKGWALPPNVSSACFVGFLLRDPSDTGAWCRQQATTLAFLSEGSRMASRGGHRNAEFTSAPGICEVGDLEFLVTFPQRFCRPFAF